MASILFRTIPKRNAHLIDIWDSGNDDFHKTQNCTDGVKWILNVSFL